MDCLLLNYSRLYNCGNFQQPRRITTWRIDIGYFQMVSEYSLNVAEMLIGTAPHLPHQASAPQHPNRYYPANTTDVEFIIKQYSTIGSFLVVAGTMEI